MKNNHPVSQDGVIVARIQIDSRAALLRTASLLLMIASLPLWAAQPLTMHLWPKSPPGERATIEPERDTTTPGDPKMGGRPVIRLGNITAPSITVYKPLHADKMGTTILVFPGGGYRILAMDLEGTEVCQWLTSIGITAVLVKYRVPEAASTERYSAPLQDAQRAIRLVRFHAKEWSLDAGRVGVLGFSAGGHLAAVLNHDNEKASYAKVDEADDGNSRPDFTILVYPAYLSVRDAGERLAPEVTVAPKSAPTFIVQAEDDRAFVEGTLLYYRALKRAGVPAELHVFSRGGHGYGLRPSADRVTSWPVLMKDWLQSLGTM